MKKSWLIGMVVSICIIGLGIVYYQSTHQGITDNEKQLLSQKNDVQSQNQVENVINNNTSVQNAENKTIKAEDLQIGNIKTSMKYDEVSRILGKQPTEQNKDFLKFNDGTEITFNEGEVYSIIVRDGNYITPRGLKVGDNILKAVQLYGEPSEKEENGHWIYNFENENYNVFFLTIKNEIVSEIEVSLVM